jgi:hypothetical protein
VAHARAKLTVLGRQLLVDRVLVDGWKPEDAAKAMGVSRQTAYKWLRRYREEGPAGLEDRTSAPRRCPHRLGEEVVAEIVAARLATLYGPHCLAYELGRPRSTIYGVLRRERVSRLSFIDRPTRTVVRYERARPGELLHVDVKKLGRIREGGGWKMHGREMGRTGEMVRIKVGYDFLHVAVDDHSRVAFVQALADEKAPTCAQFVRDATAYFASEGVTIERVMTDNARNYTPRPSSSRFFATLGSGIGAPGSIAPRRMARLSGSIGPCSRSSPTRRCSPPTTSVSRHSDHGWLPTMRPDLIRPSEGSPLYSGSVNNADGNHN